MPLRANGFDLWVFHKQKPEPKYLLLHTSKEKADKWFNGGRFWQVLSGPIQEDEGIETALLRPLQACGLTPNGIWAVEHTCIFYNLRYKSMVILPVFAAEVPSPQDIPLTWEHSEYGWYTAAECESRIHFRGLKDGLKWTRAYVSEADVPADELRII